MEEIEIKGTSYLLEMCADLVLFIGAIVHIFYHFPLCSFVIFKLTIWPFDKWLFHHFQTQTITRLCINLMLFLMINNGFTIGIVYNFFVRKNMAFAFTCYNVWNLSAWIFVAYDQAYIFMKKKLYPNRNHYPRLKSKWTRIILMPVIHFASFVDLLHEFDFRDGFFVKQIIGRPQNFNPLLAPAA